MGDAAIIWTEGKTDWQHLKRAHRVLEIATPIRFEEDAGDLGDDQLLKQCMALARVAQPLPTIFLFDRDKDEIVARVTDSGTGFRSWGNNVYSFALPVPAHREDQPAICIELCYTDNEIRTTDAACRRLYLSSEFDPGSGRLRADTRLSIGNKGKLSPGRGGTPRIIDAEVYDEQFKNVALPKSDFARLVADGIGAFGGLCFEPFRAIFAIIDSILDQARAPIDLPFGELDSFLSSLAEMEAPQQLVAIVEAAIGACKLTTMAFAAATVRYYERAIVGAAGVDNKRARPIRQLLADQFTHPSLATLHRLSRTCYHLIDDAAPDALQTLRSVMAENPTLGHLGDLLDLLERLLPPDRRQARLVNKSAVKKPVLEWVIPELARYEPRLADLATATTVPGALDTDAFATCKAALSMLVDIFAPVRSLPIRVRTIERVDNNSDEFVVRQRTYRDGRATEEEVMRAYQDLQDDRLETYELLLDGEEGSEVLGLYPFLVVRHDRLHYYNRTRRQGYEYLPFSGRGGHVKETKRKFSREALRGTVATDWQALFWTQVAPSVGPTGVKANIPPHPEAFVGRRQQLTAILDEIVQIPNENGIIHGIGGVGKTALLIELSRKVFAGAAGELPFRNIIWVTAKRDYYDPMLGVIEQRQQQFDSLDHILTSILAFEGREQADEYEREERRALVLEFLREEPTLLILDNFETVPPASQDEIRRFFGVDVKRLLRDRPHHFKVLITSRELIPSAFQQFSLSGLDEQESKQLMERLYTPYQRSGQPQLPEEQQVALHETTRGIPILIKHCYGQIYEYRKPVDAVLRGLALAGNKVVDFSFAEMFELLRRDDLQLRTILLLELVGRPLQLRQMADMLGAEETAIVDRLSRLVNFQCVKSLRAGSEEKFTVNDDVRIFTRRLAQENALLAGNIKRQVAGLAMEKRMDYTSEESDMLRVFQDYLGQRQDLAAEDYIQERLREHPNSVLLNLHYAKYQADQKGRIDEAIERLERIRAKSGNDSQVLRLLVDYYSKLQVPLYEQAQAYARELEQIAGTDAEIRFDLARFYTGWSTTIMRNVELDPLKDMLRQQRYKELADQAIAMLRGVDCSAHQYQHLLAQCYLNKWDYEAARRHIRRAINSLPPESYLEMPYRRLNDDIHRRRSRYAGRGHHSC